jgi:hypothetical protein
MVFAEELSWKKIAKSMGVTVREARYRYQTLINRLRSAAGAQRAA